MIVGPRFRRRLAAVIVAAASVAMLHAGSATAAGQTINAPSTPQLPGGNLPLSGQGWVAAPDGTSCQVQWDGTVQDDTCDIDSQGNMSDPVFVIPETASLGLHTITVCQPLCIRSSEAAQTTVDVERHVTVPDVVGQTFKRAQALVEKAVLTLAPEPQAAGQLIATQEPVAGTIAFTHGSVQVTYRPIATMPKTPSAAPPTQHSAPGNTVIVPDLRNDQTSQALQVLAGTGLRGAVSGPTPGVVDQQDPAPGTRVPPGTTVQLRLRTDSVAPVVPAANSTRRPAFLFALLALPLLLIAGSTEHLRRRRRRKIRQSVRAELNPQQPVATTDVRELADGPQVRLEIRPLVGAAVTTIDPQDGPK